MFRGIGKPSSGNKDPVTLDLEDANYIVNQILDAVVLRAIKQVIMKALLALLILCNNKTAANAVVELLLLIIEINRDVSDHDKPPWIKNIGEFPITVTKEVGQILSEINYFKDLPQAPGNTGKPGYDPNSWPRKGPYRPDGELRRAKVSHRKTLPPQATPSPCLRI